MTYTQYHERFQKPPLNGGVSGACTRTHHDASAYFAANNMYTQWYAKSFANLPRYTWYSWSPCGWTLPLVYKDKAFSQEVRLLACS